MNYGVFFYAFLLKSAPHAQILTSITAGDIDIGDISQDGHSFFLFQLIADLFY